MTRGGCCSRASFGDGGGIVCEVACDGREVMSFEGCTWVRRGLLETKSRLGFCIYARS